MLHFVKHASASIVEGSEKYVVYHNGSRFTPERPKKEASGGTVQQLPSIQDLEVPHFYSLFEASNLLSVNLIPVGIR